jgi:periplasmic protein TonB
MNWVRAGAIVAALGVHAAALALLVDFGARDEALQTGAGRDDLSVVATVTMQSEDSIGLDAVTAERQEASAAANAVPEIKQQEAKREDAIEMDPPPPEESAPPQAPIQAKPVEKPVEKQEQQPSNPSLAAAAQEEQRAISRELEARRNQAFSLYNAEIYRAIVSHAIRPKEVKMGRVGVELTLSPGGKLITRRVVKSSGVHLLDETAIANLERVPFPPPPAGLVKEPYTVTFSFDYSVK